MNDAPPMSDAPPMTQEDAAEDRYIKDRFMNGGIFKAKKAAIKEQKSNLKTNGAIRDNTKFPKPRRLASNVS